MLMAGQAQYSQIDGYREISCDLSVDNINLDISEGKLIQNGEDVVLLCKLSKFEGFWKAEELKTDELFYLPIHSGKYKVYRNKAQVEVDPSEFEKAVLEYLKTEEGKALLSINFKGTFSSHAAPAVLDMIKKNNGWNAIFADFVEVEASAIKGDVSVKARGKGGYGAKLQSEAERLADRKAFFLNELRLEECKTIGEALIIIDSPDYGVTQRNVDVILSIMNTK